MEAIYLNSGENQVICRHKSFSLIAISSRRKDSSFSSTFFQSSICIAFIKNSFRIEKRKWPYLYRFSFNLLALIVVIFLDYKYVLQLCLMQGHN